MRKQPTPAEKEARFLRLFLLALFVIGCADYYTIFYTDAPLLNVVLTSVLLMLASTALCYFVTHIE